MDAERWRRIDELCAAALERAPADRDAFLDRACAGDRELRDEVSSLLAHHREDGFLEEPVGGWVRSGADDPAGNEILVGRRLGRFEVLGKLGAGGMGEVFVAHDSKLERQVALKVLPTHLADDPERIRRFRREALAVSALNHPNILTIHEVAEVEGRELLVSELVEGQTLRDRLRRGPLPVAEAIDLATQIARALTAAHGTGIVHRDLKPENVMIRRDGVVKVLDFGLAKSLAAPADADETAPWASGTGMILGTPSYMSPEQARGEPATRQSDVWGLGCVLFESLTGGRAFPASSAAEGIEAVLAREPAWDALPRETPASVRSLLRRCLQKNPDRRLRDVADALLELEDAAREPVETEEISRPGGRWLAWGGVALAAALAAGLLGGVLAGPAIRPAPETGGPGAVPARFELPPPPGTRYYLSVESQNLAISPDGRRLAFLVLSPEAGDTELWVRPLDALAAEPVPGTEGASSVFWSPDGENLGFVANGKLRRVRLDGEAPVVLCDLPEGSGVTGSWGRDSILFASIQGEGIHRVPAAGGTPEPVLTPDQTRDEIRLVWPWFLPDGERFLYLSYRSDGGSEVRLMGRDGEARTVAEMASRIEVVDSGFAIFRKEAALIAQRFDADRAVLLGEPRPLSASVRSFGSTGTAMFATSRGGTVAVVTASDVHRVTLVDPEGRVERTIGSPMVGNSLAASRDGRRAIVDRLRPGSATYDLWMLDLVRGLETRLTDGPGTEVHPLWMPDGRSILFSGTVRSIPNLRSLDLATGVEQEVASSRQFQIAVGTTSDAELLYRERSPKGGFELRSVPLAGGDDPRPMLRPGTTVLDADLSPDGRILAYVSPEAGNPEVFVRLLAGGESLRVSEATGWRARFSPDGEWLFFTTGDHQVARVGIRSDPSLLVGAPETLFPAHDLGWMDFDVLPDGRFLALVREIDGRTAPITILTGWDPEG